jgi:hypothetical protein
MQGHPIIPYTSKLKKPIQIPALFFAEFPALDKMLVDQSNHPAVFAGINPFIQ